MPDNHTNATDLSYFPIFYLEKLFVIRYNSATVTNEVTKISIA